MALDGQVLLQGSRELGRYLRSFRDCLGRPENFENFAAFTRGQLSTVERKALEPIADHEGVPVRGLQRFFHRSNWDEDAVRRKHQRRISRKHGSADSGIFLVDETADAKKGTHTAGVSRQYCGETGKTENCIVSVHLGYAQGDFHGLLDGELFLPECWDPDPGNEEVQEKRRRAKIPPDVGHVTKPELGLRMLRRALENGVKGRYVVADEAYGNLPRWRRAVGELGLTYVVEASANHCYGWTQEPESITPERTANHKPRKAVPKIPPKKLGDLLNAPEGLRFRRRIQLRVKETHKGPEIWEFKDSSFWQNRGKGRWRVVGGFHYPEVERVLVGKNLRTGEVKFFFTNDHESSLEQLVAVAFSRWRIERCFQDCKQELGLNHAEIRSYRGLRRHLLLTGVTYLFLHEFVKRHGLKKGGP